MFRQYSQQEIKLRMMLNQGSPASVLGEAMKSDDVGTPTFYFSDVITCRAAVREDLKPNFLIVIQGSFKFLDEIHKSIIFPPCGIIARAVSGGSRQLFGHFQQ